MVLEFVSMQQKSYVCLIATVRINKNQSPEAPPSLVSSSLENLESSFVFLERLADISCFFFFPN